MWTHAHKLTSRPDWLFSDLKIHQPTVVSSEGFRLGVWHENLLPKNHRLICVEGHGPGSTISLSFWYEETQLPHWMTSVPHGFYQLGEYMCDIHSFCADKGTAGSSYRWNGIGYCCFSWPTNFTQKICIEGVATGKSGCFSKARWKQTGFCLHDASCFCLTGLSSKTCRVGWWSLGRNPTVLVCGRFKVIPLRMGNNKFWLSVHRLNIPVHNWMNRRHSRFWTKTGFLSLSKMTHVLVFSFWWSFLVFWPGLLFSVLGKGRASVC